MTTIPRGFLAVLAVAVVLAGIAGPVGGETTTAQLRQEPVVTELDLRASLTGELVVVAGWFEVTALVDGRLDTGAQETDLGGTVDVDLAEPFGEFAYRGAVVGTVNASRVLFAFEGNASTLGWSAEVVPPTASAATGGDGGASRNVGLAGTAGVLTIDPGSSEPPERTPAVDPTERLGRPTASVPPLQLRPFRQLGISFFDLYWQLATLVLGLLVVGLFPNASRRVADLGASDPLRTGGAGLAVVFLVPVALLVLGLSLFGIPLAVAGAAVYLVLWWVGAVYGRFTVGLWVLGAVPRALALVDIDARRVENRWAGLLVGTAVVGLLVLLPTVGPLVEAVVLLLGLGGITRLAYGSYRRTERVERAPTVEAGVGSGDE
ncbi:hypothetical protein [Halorarius halobius]|uniref:hypothetical protein n=1 Tax=Halorarius halobius TaxID=2962671 RepID=UPI0020CC0153|nr:hypothetical protein [Halorarius halobius]